MKRFLRAARPTIRRARKALAASPGRAVPLIAATATILAGAAIVANLTIARRTERRHPPRGRFVDVDGVSVHYIEKGTGSPLVLIHGNGVTADDWELSGVLDRLALSHRVIAFDRAGFGYTDRPRTTIWTAKAQAELLRAAMRKLDVGNTVVVGHSWGTLVALNMVLDDPAEIAGLVLMSGYYRPTFRMDVLPMIGPALPLIGDLIRYTLSPLVGWLMAPLVFKQLFSPAPVTERFKDGFPTSISLRPSQIRASAADTVLMVPEAAKTVNRHDELRMPVLIMAGRGDKVVSCRHQSEALAEDIEQSELHLLDGAGHMIQHIAPDEVASAIIAFADLRR